MRRTGVWEGKGTEVWEKKRGTGVWERKRRTEYGRRKEELE